jgi:hypothetical protein
MVLPMKWKTIRLSSLTLLVIGYLCLPSMAQEEFSPEANETALKSQSRESVYETVKSFPDEVSQNARNHFGFSVGVFEIYSSNVYSSDVAPSDATVTSFYPRVYANVNKRKSQFHFDYGFGYGIYKNQSDLNAAEHVGNLTYDVKVSRKVSFKISDRVSSSNNDYASPLNPIGAPPMSHSAYSYDPLLSHQRTTQNTVEGEIQFGITRKSSLGFFSSYQIYRRDIQEPVNTDMDGILAGVGYEYQVAKWLSIRSSYSAYLNNVNENYDDSKTSRLEVGSFHFKLGRTWDIEVAGGADFVYLKNHDHRIGWNFRQRLSHVSRTNSFAVMYQRDFRSLTTVSGPLQSDSVSTDLGHRLTRWMTFQASFSYMNGREAFDVGKLRSYMGNSALQFAISPCVIATMSYGYQYQTNTIHVAPSSLNINRSVAYVGLQYLWPSSRR